jgi:VWFA-related protein
MPRLHAVKEAPEKAMTGQKVWAAGLLLLTLTFAGVRAQAQQTPSNPNIPDAPSAKQKPQNFPSPSPYPPAQTSPTPEQQAPPPAVEPPPSEPLPRTGESSSNQSQPETPNPPPVPQVTTARPGSTTADQDSRDQLFRLTSNVNFVNVPVTVKDQNGRLVEGLLQKDFAIYEDGERQNIRFFTSDPFPLSAAVIIDTGMSDQMVQKVQDTLSTLAGAFSQFDEIAIYLYGETVQRISNFSSAAPQIEAALRRVKMKSETERRTGSRGGVPFAGGPFNTQSPTINGKPVDPNQPLQPIARPEPRVLNDAVLMSAQDLGRQERTRRRILFVISDGAERGSKTSYADALKVLLTNEVQVYGLVMGTSAMPIVGRVERIHIPGQGYGNILPKYASATGGALVSALDTKAIEEAYNTATYQARNQYTIGYQTRATLADTYHEVEVRVHRPSLTVTAKTGYYSLPPKPPAKTPPPTQPPSQQ